MNDTICPCRVKDANPLAFSACCEPILSGAKPAETAEALMRSRYSAFARGEIDYLRDSLAPQSRHDFNRAATTEWSTTSKWLGLDILGVEQGGVDDNTGVVSFIAHFHKDGQTRAHRERSRFARDEQDGRWYFVDEINAKGEPIVLGPQPGRNDP